MLFRIQFIVALIAFSAIMTILQGCASGVRVLGEVSIAEGLVRKYIQIGSEGHDSARLTVIESFDIRTDAAGAVHVTQANDPIIATTDGLVGKVVQGTGAAAMAAGGQVGAAYLRRPNLYKNTTIQSGGGAEVATSTSTETATSATSEGSEALALGVGEGGKGGSSSSESSSEATGGQGGQGGKSSSTSVSSSESNSEGGLGGEGGHAYSTGVEEGGIAIDNANQQEQFQGQGQKGDGKGNSFVFSNDNNTKKQNDD